MVVGSEYRNLEFFWIEERNKALYYEDKSPNILFPNLILAYSIFNMRNFRELKIWQKAFQIATNSFQITGSFPKQERFGLASQINRAGISIPSNIAEGCSRNSNKDCSRFLEISIGSCFELETQLLIAKELNFGNQELILFTLQLLTEEEKMLTAFKHSLKQQLNSQ